MIGIQSIAQNFWDQPTFRLDMDDIGNEWGQMGGGAFGESDPFEDMRKKKSKAAAR